jgi:hypothetical protein
MPAASRATPERGQTQSSEGCIRNPYQSVNLTIKPSEGLIFRYNTEQREPIRSATDLVSTPIMTASQRFI